MREQSTIHDPSLHSAEERVSPADASGCENALLSLRDVSVSYDGIRALSDVSFSLHAGDWLMIAGPNGAGKSTLVRAISGESPFTGEISLLGRDIRSYRTVERAQQVGILAQGSALLQYPFTVEEVVRLGRYAYKANKQDAVPAEAHVDRALDVTGLADMRHRSVLSLSGGEQQRVFLAQLFAQDPRIMILDEPANHLDLIYQKQTFSLLRDWLAQEGRALISIVHDLSLARTYGTHALLLQDGHIVADGPPQDALHPDVLNTVYGMDVAAWMRTLLRTWNEEA